MAEHFGRQYTPSIPSGGENQNTSTTTSWTNGGSSWTLTYNVDRTVTSSSSPGSAWDHSVSSIITTTVHSVRVETDATVTTDSNHTATADIHYWGPGPTFNPSTYRDENPYSYSAVQIDTGSSHIFVVQADGRERETEADSYQSVTQTGSVAGSGDDTGQMVFSAHGTTTDTDSFSDTNAIGNTQSEDVTTFNHYVVDSTQGRGLNDGTGNFTITADSYLNGQQAETWGSLSPGSNGFSHTATGNTQYDASASGGTDLGQPADWTVSQDADQGFVFQTAYHTVTDDGLTIDQTVNASETDTASSSISKNGAPTVSANATNSLGVIASIRSPDGGSTTFTANRSQTLGTNEILGFLGPIWVGWEAANYIWSMKQPDQPDIPLHPIGPNPTSDDIRKTYWNSLATRWNNGLYAWPFTGTPGKVGGGNGNYDDRVLDPRPVAEETPRIPPPKLATNFSGIVLSPYWTVPLEPDWKQHLRVYVRHYISGYVNPHIDYEYDTGVMR